MKPKRGSIRSCLQLCAMSTAIVFTGCAVDGEMVEEAVEEQSFAQADLQLEIEELLVQHPTAFQISDHEIAWNDGTVVLSLPVPEGEGAKIEAAATVEGCPSGWFCFYQHINFNRGQSGRRLQFSDCASAGVTQFLTDYGFQNQTSSWVVNKSLNFVNVNDFDPSPGFPNGRNWWNSPGNSRSSWVGDAANDRVDWFICYL